MTVQKDPEGIEQTILHAFTDFKDKRVLEIGCGEGRLTFKYAGSAKRVVAFDPDHDSLRVARADCPVDLDRHVHFTGASAKHIPFQKEIFDIAILAWSL
ncbi:MAG: class I SAM-dependent methyltransferase [Anaerolineales bacterium]|nr:MAG: class I SAM-dependent methyltransferase [Anaerolineales bacterium]